MLPVRSFVVVLLLISMAFVTSRVAYAPGFLHVLAAVSAPTLLAPSETEEGKGAEGDDVGPVMSSGATSSTMLPRTTSRIPIFKPYLETIEDDMGFLLAANWTEDDGGIPVVAAVSDESILRLAGLEPSAGPLSGPTSFGSANAPSIPSSPFSAALLPAAPGEDEEGEEDGDGSATPILLATTDSDLAVMPLPGAAWLFLSAIGGLVTVRHQARKKGA